MLKVFIYEEKKDIFQEVSDMILWHDLCAIFDDEKKMVYIWNGPKSTEKLLEKGYEKAIDLVADYPDGSVQLMILEEDIPPNIQKKLDEMLVAVKKRDEEERTNFSHLTTIRLYFLTMIITIILPIISIFVNLSSMGWPMTNAIASVDYTSYNTWLITSYVLIVITLIISILNILIGLFEKDEKTGILSVSTFIVCIGILSYLSFGGYLFLFQPGSTDTTYLISQADLGAFSTALLLVSLIIILPTLISLLKFTKDYKDYLY